MEKKQGACEEENVAALYQDDQVADSYCERRFAHTWSRLLHQKQVAAVNQIIQRFQPEHMVELAPGPARLTTEIKGVRSGIMVEYSKEMLALAQKRLGEAGLTDIWDLRHGNAFELQAMNIHCDFLFTFRFIRHFNESDRSRLYRQIHGCLNAGGHFMVDVVNRPVRERIDAKRPERPEGELPVYDMSYTQKEFESEMHQHGFLVNQFIPVVKYFDIQSWSSFTFDHRSPLLAKGIVSFFELIPSAMPLEWVTVCQKTN